MKLNKGDKVDIDGVEFYVKSQYENIYELRGTTKPGYVLLSQSAVYSLGLKPKVDLELVQGRSYYKVNESSRIEYLLPLPFPKENARWMLIEWGKAPAQIRSAEMRNLLAEGGWEENSE